MDLELGIRNIPESFKTFVEGSFIVVFVSISEGYDCI